MKLGLTGGMGSGKSTAARFFSEHGLQRIDSDAVVREQILTLPDVIAAVEKRFGPEVMGADGRIDRGRLAARVFVDDTERQWLEEQIHPRLYAIWRSRMAADRAASWVIEVPLLFEKRLENWFDFTLCVATSSAVQLARLEERGVPRVLAEQRISKQLPLAQKLELADYVLLNDGDVEFLHAQIVHLLRHLRG
jgi:dephospho-CoA kinase